MSGDGKSSAQLSVVGALTEPTTEDVEGILGEMIDNGVQISLADALASVTLVAQAKAIFRVREQKRLKEAEEKAEKEAEAAQRAEEARRKAVERVAEAELQRMLEVETAPPAKPEAIAAFVQAAERNEIARPQVVSISALVSNEFDGITVVEPIDTMKQKYGSMLPAIVFTMWQYAAAFRGWLAKYKRPVLDALKFERQKLSAEQDAEYISRLEGRMERFDGLFVMINEVIIDGWGKDPKKNMAEYDFFARVEDACNNEGFAGLRDVPQQLTAEEKQKQADEAKAREAMAKAREACQSDMVARLIIAGFIKDDAEKMSGAWLRKWDGQMSAVVVLTTKAVNFALANESDKAAKLAKAAGIMDDAFDALVGAKRVELKEAAEKLATRAVSNRGPQAGAATRDRPVKKDKGGKKNKDNKRGGKEDRRKK